MGKNALKKIRDSKSGRPVRHVREFVGQRLKALRKQRLLSQEKLGYRAGISGKFIGEVERGEKSISIDSLYRVSVALEVPLRDLTDVQNGKNGQATVSEEAQRVYVFVTGLRRPEDAKKAHDVLRAMFGKTS